MTEENTQPAANEGAMKYLPEMNAVESSNINALGYDGNNAFVEFKDGTHWMYTDVPASTYTDWMKSESVGKFFHASIRGKYNSARWLDDQWVDSNEVSKEADNAEAAEGNDTESEQTTTLESQPDTAQEAPDQPTVAGDDYKVLIVDMAITVNKDVSPETLAEWLVNCPYGVKIDGVRDVNVSIEAEFSLCKEQAA